MFGKGVNQTSGGDICLVLGFPADVCQAGSSGKPGTVRRPEVHRDRLDPGPWPAMSTSLTRFPACPKTSTERRIDHLLGGASNGPAPGQLNGEGVAIYGKSTDAQGIAVGPNGDLNVMQRYNEGGIGQRIYEFTESGSFVRTLPLEREALPFPPLDGQLGNYLDGGPNGNGGSTSMPQDGQALTQDFSNNHQGGYEILGRTTDVVSDPKRKDDYYLSHPRW